MVERMVVKLTVIVVVAESHGREERRENSFQKKNWGGEGWFFLIFEPDFLYVQAMKSTPIYRGWKMVILSSHEKNFQPLVRLVRIPTVGSK